MKHDAPSTTTTPQLLVFPRAKRYSMLFEQPATGALCALLACLKLKNGSIPGRRQVHCLLAIEIDRLPAEEVSTSCPLPSVYSLQDN